MKPRTKTDVSMGNLVDSDEQARERLFRALIEHGREAVLLLDRDGSVIYAGSPSERIIGYDLRRASSIRIADFAHPDEVEALEQQVDALLESPSASTTLEFRARHADGSWVWVEAAITNLLDDPTIAALICTFRDVNESRLQDEERERILDQLERERARFEAVLQQMPAGVGIAEAPSGRVVLRSRQLDIIFRRPTPLLNSIEEYAQYQGFHDDGTPYTPADWPLTRAIRSGEVVTNEEVDVVRGDSSLGRVRINAAPIRDAEGQIVAGVTVIDDVTEYRLAERALRVSEERYRTFLAQSSEGIWRMEIEVPVPVSLPADEQIVCFYEHGRIAECNDVMAQMYGYESTFEMIGKRLDNLLDPDDPANLTYLRRFVETGYRMFDDESHEFDRYGQPKVFLNNCVGIVENGAVVRAWGSQRDITERKRAEDALRVSEERYALAARGANDGLWDWNLATNSVYFSPRWKQMLGYGEDDLGDSPNEWFVRVFDDDRAQLDDAISKHLEGRTPHFESEYRVRHKDGSVRWMLARGLAVRGADAVAYRIAGSQTDITDRRQAEAELVQRAFYDALTRLPNRDLFLERLSRAVERAKRKRDHRFAILFLDLDRFKVINDSLGHQAGDRLIAMISSRLRTCLRENDTLARLGGDEFAVLMEIEDVSDALNVAARIKDVFGKPFPIDASEVFTSASIGIAVNSEHHESPDALLKEADIAMYRAKAAGKAGHVLYDESLHAHVTQHLRFETELRRAIDRREFFVEYQPMVELSSGRVIGFEALVRWQHPSLGVIQPKEFVSVAEETNLILPVDRWVLNEACEQLRTWKSKYRLDPRFAMSVNFSSKQFSQGDLVETIGKILHDTRADGAQIKLEITENVLMEESESAARVLSQLKSLGVSLLIDDFGTGYSSLGYLHQFPIDALKIDRSFINRLDAGGKEIEIVRAILALADGLEMDVIAEGVETLDQVRVLQGLRCRYGQGYYYSRPVSAADAEFLLRAD
jgi:diguanylate cyclase (GGDEF)-like protein/PAS domain S-box-containing protein